MLETNIAVDMAEMGNVSPAVAMLLDTIEVVQQRQQKYGSPATHWKRTVGMLNAAFGEVLTRPLTLTDWGIIMEIDKIARFLGPEPTADGPVDMAGYAACISEVRGMQ